MGIVFSSRKGKFDGKWNIYGESLLANTFAHDTVPLMHFSEYKAHIFLPTFSFHKYICLVGSYTTSRLDNVIIVKIIIKIACVCVYAVW